MKISTFKVIMLALAILVGSCDSPSDDILYGRWRLEKYSCIATSSYGLTQINNNQSIYCSLITQECSPAPPTAIQFQAILKKAKTL